MAAIEQPTQARIRHWWQAQQFRQQAIEAFKTGLAAALCLGLGHLLGLAHSYWAAISAIVVMGSNTSVTFTSARTLCALRNSCRNLRLRLQPA